MNAIKCFVVAGLTVGLMFGALNAYAGNEKGVSHKDRKHAKQMPELSDMTLTGKLVKEETTKKGKDGTEKTFTKFTLKTDDGSIFLPPSKDFDMSALADKTVKVEGKGFESNGKKILRKLTKVVEAEAAPVSEE